MKNMKIGAKIALVVSLILIIGLGSVMAVTVTNVRSTTKQDTENRLGELCNARAAYVEAYINQFCEYFHGLTTMQESIDALSNPDDPEKVAAAQRALQQYISTRQDMEGLFLATKETKLICHTVEKAIGSQISDDPAVWKNREEGVGAAPNHVWFRGAVVSTSTGAIVGNVYAGVYNSAGELLGYAGGGNFLQNVTEKVYSMDLNGYEEAQVYVINVNAGNYVMSADESEIGKEITADDQDVVEAVKTSNKGIMEYTDESTGARSMLAYEYLPNLGMVLYVCDTEAEIFANANKLATLISILCVAVLIVSIIVVVIITRIISNELDEITDVIQVVGTLDLTQTDNLKKYQGRKDEVGKIADATSTLTDAVKNAVINLMQKAGLLSESSGHMQDNTNATASSIGSINLAATELARTATSTAENVTDISMRMHDVERVMEQSSKNTSTLSDASVQIRSTVETGMNNVEELKDISAQSMGAFNEIFTGIDNIAASSSKISEASDMIKSIAEQTNLLSLNASIEAARAGEAGKGFAVVADEIRNLSDQSSQSVETINEMLMELQKDTQNAVKQSELVKDFVNRQQASVEQTAESFSSIADQIGSVNDAIDGLDAANRQLADGVSSISDSISNLSAISEENAATAEELNATTETVNNNVEDLDTQGKDVASAAEELHNIVGVFKTEE